MALKLGTLFFELAARTSGLEKGITNATKVIEKFGNDMKKVGAAAQQMAVIVNGAIAGSLVVASKLSDKVGAATGHLKTVMASFSVELATAVLPSVQSLTQKLSEILAWYQHLSPAQKESIAKWIQFTAVALGAVAVLGKLGGAISAVATVVKMLAGITSLPLIVLLGALALVAVGLVTAYGFVKEAMEGAFGPAMQARVERMSGIVGGYVDMLRAWASGDTDAGFAAQQKIDKATSIQIPKSESMFGGKALGEVLKSSFERGAAELKKAIEGALPAWMTGKGTAGPARLYGEREKPEDDGVTGYAHKPNMGRGGGYTDVNPLNYYFNQLLREEEERLKGYRELGAKFRSVNERAIEDEQRARDAGLKAFKEGLVSRFMSAAGKMGAILNNAIGAFQQAGVWGALISVVADFFMETQLFANIVRIGNEGLSQTVGVLNMFFRAFGPITDIIKLINTAALWPLFIVLKSFGVLVLSIAKYFGEWVNSVIGAINEVFGSNIAAINLDGLNENLDRLNSTTYEMATAATAGVNRLDAFGEAVGHAAAAAVGFTESFTNIPSTFKLAAARFGAQDAGGGMGPLVHGASPVTAGRSGQRGEIINININGNVIGGLPEDIVDQIEKALGRRRYVRKGAVGTI